MANDTTPTPEPETVELEAPQDGGATTDGKGGYMSGETIPGGGTATGTGSSA